MSTVIDYLKWRGDLAMDTDGFQLADNFLLSAMCYANLSGIVPKEGSIALGEAAKRYRELGRCEADASTQKKGEIALFAMADTRRFCDTRLTAYEDVLDEASGTQFAAVTAELADGTCYIAFRGTDDHLVGWREDFEMCSREVGAQSLATAYLNRQLSDGRYRIGGHSKGGNLAVYAGMCCEDEKKERIVQIYSNDGPGISAETMDEARYRMIEDRIIRIWPHFTMVGTLFANAQPDYIVASSEKALKQHNPLTWQLDGMRLKTQDSLDRQCAEFARAFNEWIVTVPLPQRDGLVNDFFGGLENCGIKKTTDLQGDFVDEFAKFFRVATGATKDTRQVIGMLIRTLTSDKVNRIWENRTRTG